jgi:alpha-beta hydrolase superfamily lysophospholipase
MGMITTTDGTEIFYKDWGTGQPIVFSHGWPLSADDWDTQMLFLLQNGYRVIAHDRRGHGRSTQTSDGHDMDHYADDLAAVTAHLDLDYAICAECRRSPRAVSTRDQASRWQAGQGAPGSAPAAGQSPHTRNDTSP